MIYFRHVWAGKKPGDPKSRHLLRDVCCDFIAGTHTGILCRNNAWWHCFFPLLSGARHPEDGEVIRAGRASWPLGWQMVFHNKLTLMENLNFFARLHGVHPPAFRKFVMDFADAHPFAGTLFGACDANIRALVAFVAPFGLPFDFMVASGSHLVAGPAVFHPRCTALVDAMMEQRTFIINAANSAHLKRTPNHLLAVKDGLLWRVESPEDLPVVIKILK